MTKLCIDPGMSGGIAWKLLHSKAAVEKMPATESDICELIRGIQNHDEIEAWLEDVPIGMPGKGAASSKLNANAGFIRGVLAALRIRVHMIRPAKWQAYFGVGKRSGCASDSEWKNKLKQVAQRLYPDIKVTLDTSDALLLLEYARAQK